MASDNRSKHYLGERGAEYFEGRFGDEMSFGRRFQSRYFAPYCSNELRLLDFGCGDGQCFVSCRRNHAQVWR